MHIEAGNSVEYGHKYQQTSAGSNACTCENRIITRFHIRQVRADMGWKPLEMLSQLRDRKYMAPDQRKKILLTKFLWLDGKLWLALLN